VSSTDLLSTVLDTKLYEWDITTMLPSKFQPRGPDIVQMARSLVPPALAFLRRSQNPDGGWGEGYDSYSKWDRAGIGASTASQTSWAVMGLLAHLPPNDDCIQRGIKYLLDNEIEMKEGGKSWVEQSYTGAGFVGSYDLRYDYYRHYFPMMALGRYAKAIETLED
jgi:squalene-hopene/tetraprenyl-beta-curcumene cyclase